MFSFFKDEYYNYELLYYYYDFILSLQYWIEMFSFIKAEYYNYELLHNYDLILSLQYWLFTVKLHSHDLESL